MSKKTVTQKAPAKKAEAKKTDPFTAIVERWRAGEGLSVLAEELGWRRSKLRKLLAKAVGGKAQYRALRAQGAGGTAEPFGGKRGRGRSAGEAPDDRKVKRIPDARAADGWRLERLYPNGAIVDVFVAPDGVKYVTAKDHEAADLIVTHEHAPMKLSPSRLKRLERTKLVQKAAKEHQEIARGEAALKAARAVKRAKRVRRKR